MSQDSRRRAPRSSRSQGSPAAARARARADAPRSADTARLTSLIEPVLTAMKLDLEAVKIATAGRRRVLRIIVDADGGVSLDDIALASTEVSARIDAKNAMGDEPYTLEVSSPGIDRPLTEPRHWRRAAGRLVAVRLTDQDLQPAREAGARQEPVQARVVGAGQDGVTLEIDGMRRTYAYRELGHGRVQVEFGPLAEMDESDDVSSPGDGADEEDRNGH